MKAYFCRLNQPPMRAKVVRTVKDVLQMQVDGPSGLQPSKINLPASLGGLEAMPSR